jgi:hypothetical protein
MKQLKEGTMRVFFRPVGFRIPGKEVIHERVKSVEHGKKMLEGFVMVFQAMYLDKYSASSGIEVYRGGKWSDVSEWLT